MESHDAEFSDHGRTPPPPRRFDRALGEPESELQATAREILTELGYVWLGDFSGWEVVPELRDAFTDAPPLRLELRHRCGFALRQPDEGITGDGAAYVGNLIERLLEAVYPQDGSQGHVCAPHEPSPEHQARVARWAAAAGVTPSGDVAQDQLGIVRALSRGAHLHDRSSAPPRLVDGPGCTPASVIGLAATPLPPRAGGPDLEDVRVECLGDSCTGCSDSQCWTARADGGDV
jgi:hypothetical protein